MSDANYAAIIDAVARELCGDPNPKLSRKGELRYGTNGSLSVNLDKATWYDHESEQGGGLLDLVTQRTGRSDAKEWLREHGYEVGNVLPAEVAYDYVDANGVLVYQVVRKPGRKFLQRRPEANGWVWNLKGVTPLLYRLPELLSRPTDTVYVVEGEKDADNLAALGLLATTNSGGAGKWRAHYADALAGHDVVVLPDNDGPGRSHAADVVASCAGKARVRVVNLPDLKEKGDVSDWLAAGGTAEELAQLCANAQPAGAANDDAQTASTWGFKFDDEMVRNLGPTRWLIQKLIPEDCTGVLYGPSGSLKSFAMIDMALSISNGIVWQGRPTKLRTVFYLAGEGEQGFAKRIAAWYGAKSLEPLGRFAFRQIPRLNDEGQLGQLVDTIRSIEAERGRAGLIVIDTLFTALDGGDENSGKDMGRIIAAMVHLRERFGSAVFAVHHTGKQGDSARGHSSLPSGMDVMLYAKPGPTPLTVEIANPKQKDGAEHPNLLLQAAVHELPIIGEDGQPETSLILSNPTSELLANYQGKTKKTEETVAKAQEAKQQEEAAADRIKAFALEQLTQGGTLEFVERAVADLAQRLGFPKLARKKTVLSEWRKEAGL